MDDYRRLRVYESSLELTESVYRFTSMLPANEGYGLTSQMRRASVSIVANIAEGAGRGSRKDFARFLRIALGSACELEAHLELVLRLHDVDGSRVDRLKDLTRSLIRQINALERLKRNSTQECLASVQVPSTEYRSAPGAATFPLRRIGSLAGLAR